MKITKSHLKQIIKEELESVLREGAAISSTQTSGAKYGGHEHEEENWPSSAGFESTKGRKFYEKNYVAPLEAEGWHRTKAIPKHLGIAPGAILNTMQDGHQVSIQGVDGRSHKASGRLIFIVKTGVRGMDVEGTYKVGPSDFVRIDNLQDPGAPGPGDFRHGKDTKKSHESWYGMQSRSGEKPEHERRNVEVYAVMVK